MGLPDLNATQMKKVLEANKMVQRCFQIAGSCVRNKVPFGLENPYNSLMWNVAELQHLARLPGVRPTRFDFCMFGEPYHKKTKVLSYGFKDISMASKVCHGRGGKCEHTGEPRELFTGLVECPEHMTHFC